MSLPVCFLLGYGLGCVYLCLLDIIFIYVDCRKDCGLVMLVTVIGEDRSLQKGLTESPSAEYAFCHPCLLRRLNWIHPKKEKKK